MTAQHTPGPWWVTDHGVRDRGGFICAMIPTQRYEGQDERFELEHAERIANCLLIGAAPDLLSALETLYAVCLAMDLERQDDRPTEDEYQAAMLRAIEAISKATGSPS